MRAVSFLLSMVGLGACQNDLLAYGPGDLKVRIEQGSAWLHDFPLFLGLKTKNPPQMAVWIEDTEGRYLSTVYATRKIATQGWSASQGNRRKEALPHWCYSRGVRYEDGLYLPTKEQPLTDGISGATPKGSFDAKIAPKEGLRQFVVKVEVNHSTDYNEFYPESAQEGAANYSGSSGQPALVYAARVDLSSGAKSFEAVLVGCSSPDGTSGEVNPDLTGITSARDIVERITVTIQ